MPFLLPISLPGSFPDLPGLRPFAIPPKTYDNGSGFWCQGEVNNNYTGIDPKHDVFANIDFHSDDTCDLGDALKRVTVLFCLY